MAFWLCDMGETYSFYLDQKAIATTPIENVSPELRPTISYWNDLYYKWKNNALVGEEITIVQPHVRLLNCQNPDFTRYAFYMEIPPLVPVSALYNRINAQLDFLLSWTQVVFDYTQPGYITGRNYLRTTLLLSATDALYWLRILTIAYLKRYSFDIPIRDTDAFIDRVQVASLYPHAVCVYGEIPDDFIVIVKSVFPIEGPEFQDKLDEVCFRAISPINLGAYIQHAYAEQEARANRWNRIKRYFIYAIAAIAMLPAIVEASLLTYATLTSPIVREMSLLSKLGLAIEVFAASLKISISSFLTAIQFDTLISIHRVAYLVSEDYRDTMRKVYGEIVAVSEALGYGPYFMTLFLQNTRNLVLDVSTTLGMKYDLAQVQWIANLHDYLKFFSAATYRYVKDPEALFYDMERWVDRPALDKKGEFLQGIILTLRNATEGIEAIVNNVTTIRDDLDRLVRQLPETIREEIQPHIQPIIDNFDDFIADNYDPYKRQMDNIINTLSDVQDTNRNNISGLVDRLKKPADYLLEIDMLEDWERTEQEIKVADISTRQFKRDSVVLEGYAEPVSAELERIRTAIRHITLEPLTLPEELPGPSRPAKEEATPRETWYIGDY